MEITLIIVAGVVLTAFFPSLFSYFSEKRKKIDKETEAKVTALEQKVRDLENRLLEKDERLGHVEKEISFINRLIEDKTKK